VTAAGDVGVPDLITMMTQVRDRLDVSAAAFTAGSLKRSDDAAVMPYTAELTLTGLSPPFSYTGELHLARAGDAWKVSARLASLHPALRPGLRLARTPPDAVRGRLLDADGRSLADDSELAGNLVGQVEPASGLQRVYDNQLTPSGGEIVVSDAAGKTVETLRTYPSADGKDVRTTLDLDVQRAGEAAMATAPKPNGALVAVDTRTGGVLALVNHPLNGYSRAIRGSYPPGSTFKIVTATAALMNGKTAETPIDCSPTVAIGGRTFQNAEDEQFGVIPFRTVFAKSCNTAFIRLEQSLPDDAVAKAAALYGFDGTRPLPIASAGGNYPTPRDDVEHASAAIGQGRVSVSPMHMAGVAAAVASGAWRQPFVTGQPARSTELPKAALPVLRDMMRAVVTEGTAKTVPFPGEVRGKTGTAEYAEGDPPPTHGWFVGYRGDVAFAVVVEDGGFGAESAAPVAARFLAGLGEL
jgi:cell division protein FtsI/penicillin-binding protein 2